MASISVASTADTAGDGAAAFPPRQLELSAEDERTLIAVANQIVSETLEASEAFEADGRVVRDDQWKLVKARENLQVFRSRRRLQPHYAQSHGDAEFAPGRPQLYSVSEDALRAFFVDEWMENMSSSTTAETISTSSSSSHSSSSLRRTTSLYDDRSVLEAAKPVKIPLVLGTGVVQGTIEDAGFGALASTEQMWQMRDVGNRNVSLNQARILARIHGPTKDDPFRFLGVKWSIRAPLRPIVQQRDFLAVESTGMATDSSGQRVFYYLNHSIELPQVPEYPDIIRAGLTICYIARAATPATPGITSVYCQGFLDGRGRMFEQVGTALLGAAISNVSSIIEVSYAKKLVWLVQAKQTSASRSSSSSTACACCSKGFTSFANPFGSRGRCTLCDRVCWSYFLPGQRQRELTVNLWHCPGYLQTMCCQEADPNAGGPPRRPTNAASDVRVLRRVHPSRETASSSRRRSCNVARVIDNIRRTNQAEFSPIRRCYPMSG